MTEHPIEKTGSTGIKKKTGFLFLGFSVLFYLLMAIVPFLNISAGTSAVIITIFLIIAELSFLVSIYLLGRELAGKYRAYFNPMNWFRKKEPTANKENDKKDESGNSE